MKIIYNGTKGYTFIDDIANTTKEVDSVSNLRVLWKELRGNPDELEIGLEHMFNNEHNCIHVGVRLSNGEKTFQFTEKV